MADGRFKIFSLLVSVEFISDILTFFGQKDSIQYKYSVTSGWEEADTLLWCASTPMTFPHMFQSHFSQVLKVSM